MECDSVHATIERTIKKKIIEVPKDYLFYSQRACKKTPYEIIEVDQRILKFFKSNLVYNSIRPGNKPHDPTVFDIRALKYENKIIFYLLNFDEQYEKLPHRRKTHGFQRKLQDFEDLFKERRSITKAKFQDLQSMKPQINKIHWKFYDELETE